LKKRRKNSSAKKPTTPAMMTAITIIAYVVIADMGQFVAEHGFDFRVVEATPAGPTSR